MKLLISSFILPLTFFFLTIAIYPNKVQAQSCNFSVTPTAISPGESVTVTITNAKGLTNEPLTFSDGFYITDLSINEAVSVNFGLNQGNGSITIRKIRDTLSPYQESSIDFFQPGRTYTLTLCGWNVSTRSCLPICHAPTTISVSTPQTPPPNPNIGNCQALGNPAHKFTCSATDAGGNWFPSNTDKCVSSEGYIPHPDCSGTFDSNKVCGPTSRECCIECQNLNTVPGDTISWGGTCFDTSTGISLGTCTTGTTCRNAICLKAKGSIAYTLECKAHDECGPSPDGYPSGTLVCRESTGGQNQCLFPVDMSCDNDAQCQTRLCNPDAKCSSDGVCQGTIPPTCDANTPAVPFDLCKQVGDPTDSNASSFFNKCDSCLQSGGIWTSLGCLPTKWDQLVPGLLKIVGTIAGGLTLLFIAFGAFTISTSTSDPQKLKNGQEMVSAAIIGLIFILFSVIILHFIGVDILSLPGL